MILLLLLWSCQPAAPNCDTDPTLEDVTGGVTSLPDGARVSADVTLRGVTHGAFAVLGIEALGVPATSVRGDYDEWTLPLTIGTLRAQGTDIVAVDPVATTACGEVRLDPFSLSVVPDTGVPVTELAASVDSDVCYLGVSAGNVMDIRVGASAESAGGTVKIATNGTVRGATDNAVVLRNDGDGAAAHLLLSATAEGSTWVALTAPAADPVFVTVPSAGVPTFSGGTSTVAAGATRRLVVSTRGQLAGCTFSADNPDDVAAVTVDGAEVATSWEASATECDPPEDHEIAITAAEDATGGGITLRCWDTLDQRSAALVLVLGKAS